MQNPSHPVTAALVLAAAALLSACANDSTTASVSGDPSAPSDPAASTAPLAASTSALFHAPEPWTKDVSAVAKSDTSDSIIGWLSQNGGWGGGLLRIDFGLKVLHAGAGTPFQSFTPTDDFYTPDCDQVPFPVPQGGSLEDETGYSCTTDGDCHLLVVHEPSQKLYEMWRADMSDGVFHGGCVAVWDLNKAYTDGRGENCTSADAGGFPLSAMTFSADEVAAGAINHALRFILPNSRIRRGVYVHPATHASESLHGGPNAPPYGVRFRLRADYPLESLPSDGARVVARALQRYGMLLADGGHVPLTAMDDSLTEHKWDEVGIDANTFDAIGVNDMEVVDMGEPIPATGDCARN
jgi:serine/threonine-protein kinase